MWLMIGNEGILLYWWFTPRVGRPLFNAHGTDSDASCFPTTGTHNYASTMAATPLWYFGNRILVSSSLFLNSGALCALREAAYTIRQQYWLGRTTLPGTSSQGATGNLTLHGQYTRVTPRHLASLPRNSLDAPQGYFATSRCSRRIVCLSEASHDGSVQFTWSNTWPAVGCVYPIRRRNRSGCVIDQ